MSWLFGLNKKGDGAVPPLEAPQVPVMGGEGGAGDPGKGGAPPGTAPEGYRSEAYSFDSTALERAAKAAKVTFQDFDHEQYGLMFFFISQDLERSKHATEALALSKMQEQTRQQEQMAKMKEYEIHLEQMKIEGKKVDGEQKRKYLEEEAKIAKHKAEYQDQLARQRYEDQLVQQQRMQEENLKKQEASVAKQ